MNKDFEKKYHSLERDHFWFKARRKYILQLLKDVPRDAKILDIGCSSGILLMDLEEIGFRKENLFGIDISSEAIQNCHENGVANTFVMDAQEIILTEKFDIIIASDCLEHLQDDHKALANWNSLLKPNGKALIFVPAFKFLWSDHDEVNMHFRRYTLKELKQKLKSNGFILQKASYWNFFLFPPIFAVRFIGRIFKSKNKKMNGDLDKILPFNENIFQLINLENKFLKYAEFPFGVSVFSVVKKGKF